MNTRQLKSLIRESIKDVLSENSGTAEEVKELVRSFIASGEKWTDSQYMELTDDDLFARKRRLNDAGKTAYFLIRQCDQDPTAPIMAIKKVLSSIVDDIA